RPAARGAAAPGDRRLHQDETGERPMSPLYRHDGDEDPHGAPLSRPVKILFTLLAVIGTIGAGFAAASYLSDRDQRRTDAVQSCRSNLNARAVLAKAEVDDVILDGLIALASDGDLVAVVQRI